MKINYIILIYLVIFNSFIACKNADKNITTINKEDRVYLKVLISNNNLQTVNHEYGKILLQGVYYNCLGHANNESWEVTNSNSLKNNSLYFKKNDKNCTIFLQKAELIINHKNSNKSEKFSFITDKEVKITQKYNLRNLILSSNENSYYFDIKIDNISNALSLFIIDKSNYLSKDKIFNGQKISLEIIPSEERNIYLNHFKVSRYNFKNTGSLPIALTSFNNDFVFNNSCFKKVLEIGADCSASFLISHASISERNFVLNAAFKFNHPEANEKFEQSNHKLKNNYKKEIFTQAQFFRDLSIYRTFSYGKLLFVAVNSPERESLYLSENGVYGPFRIVEGIPHGIEIRGLKVYKDKIYVIAYKNNERVNYGGLYVANLNMSPSKFKNMLANSSERIYDFLGIASNDKNVYVATKSKGLFAIDYKTDSLKKIPVRSEEKDIDNFHEVFVYNDHVFAVYENNVYYAKETNFNFFKINTNILTNEIKSLYVYKNKIILGTNSGLYYSKLTAASDNFLEVFRGGFIQDNSFKNNDIYDMKLFGNSLYIATICFISGCSKNDGIYYKNLDSELGFNKIFSPEYSNIAKTKYMGIFVSNNDIIASTGNGFQYLNLFYPSLVNTNDVKKVFRSQQNMYLIKNGFDDGFYFSQDLGLTSFRKRKINLYTDGIISIQEVDNYLCILIKSNNTNRGLWCSENKENLDFKKVNEFSNFDILGMSSKNNIIFIYSKNYIFYVEKNDSGIKVKNFVKFAAGSEYTSSSREEIRDIHFENNVLFLLTNKSVYFSRFNEVNINSEVKINFKKILLNLNLNPAEEIKSFYKYNNYILLGTSHGLYSSINGINGNFKNIHSLSSGAVESILGLGSYAYIVVNSNLYLAGLNEDFSESYFNKFDNKTNKLLYDNFNFYYLNDYFLAKNNKINQNSNYSEISVIKNDKFIDGIFYNKKMYILSERYIYIKSNENDFLEILQENTLGFSKIFEFNQEIYLLNKDGLYKLILSKIHKVSDHNMSFMRSNFDEAFFIKDNEIFYTTDFLSIAKLDLDVDKNYVIKGLYFNQKYLYFYTSNTLFLYDRENKSIQSVLTGKFIKDIKLSADSLYVLTRDEFLVSKDYGSSFTLLKSRGNEGDFDKIHFLIADNYLNVFTCIQTARGFIVSGYY